MTDLAVIMSVYCKDSISFLKESVSSILNQTYGNFHYYIVFDGPVSSGINEYVYSLKDDRIRLYELETNQGLAAALNYLLAIVLSNTGYKFIARMDADDVSLSGRFESQRQYLISYPDITVLGTWYEEIDESGNYLHTRHLPCNHKQLSHRFMIRTPFAHSSVMVRRNLFDIAGYYPTDTHLMEDNLLWGTALANGLKFSNLDTVLHKLRIDNDFYKRRTGILYGLNYIRTKFRIIRILGASPVYYFVSFCFGFLRMMPPFFFRLLRNF